MGNRPKTLSKDILFGTYLYYKHLRRSDYLPKPNKYANLYKIEDLQNISLSTVSLNVHLCLCEIIHSHNPDMTASALV